MQSATFRKWLAEHGCRFDQHEHERRGEGPVLVTVHREGRKSQVPLGGSRQDLDPRDVRRACEELGLDWDEGINKRASLGQARAESKRTPGEIVGHHNLVGAGIGTVHGAYSRHGRQAAQAPE